MKERFFGATRYDSIPGGKKKLEYVFSVLMDMGADRSRLRVLDVGCGNGAIAFAVASIGCEVLGIDVDESSIERARRTNGYPNARFEVVAGDNFNLKNKYDLIICSEVLEHLHRPMRLLLTMARHMKDDGRLLITVPNGYGPREVLGRTENVFREKLGLGKLIDRARAAAKVVNPATKVAVHSLNPDQDHVQKFTTGSLKWMIERAGLRLVETVNSIFFFSVLLRSKSGVLDKIDAHLADFLPHSMVSGWYLLCEKAAG